MSIDIGGNIKKLRKERKITQQELARNVGLSRSYLSDIENNRNNPSLKTIESLSVKLNISIHYLISLDDKFM